MTTERQLAANRANAKRSTGPKTGVGRSVSSRNALRHGLASRAKSEQTTLVDIDGLAKAIAGKLTDEVQVICAGRAAKAHVDLLRVRAARVELLRLFASKGCDVDELALVIAIDRYERIARSERRRATAAM